MGASPDDDSRASRELGQAETDAGGEPQPARSASRSTPASFEEAIRSPGGRYQILDLLGRGGMGEVHKAFDPQLNRYVALKLMHRGSPELASRLLHEARAQARVDHENICKVYGVGELDGQPFIALQLIDGKTLRELYPSLTREQRIKIMREVADALHAAHRQGLVHRDVKPGNVLVEKSESGEYKPYVTDFGLAREIESAGVTVSGVAVGTPLYMAPEQARGDTKNIDRRTDVYGLGATLYELLAGQPPFRGDSSALVLMQILHAEPTPLRRLIPDIPPDLETIVVKAMEKNPARRYETARALAEDLQRFLDGDPILARPSSLGYRLAKRARKQLGLVIASSVALVIAAVMGGLTLRARQQAAAQARVAQRFGEEVAKIGAIARDAALLPLHDTRRELQIIRQRMNALEARIGALGTIAAGPGHYALGRGWLALERYDQAARELDASYLTGFRSPELSFALGLAHGELYQQALARISGSDPGAQARRQELVRTHRDPALRHLREVSGREGTIEVDGVSATEYVESLIALYEERFGDALELARKAAERVPGMFEARILEGDIHLTAGKERSWNGDVDGAAGELERAGEAYRAASEIARSSSGALAGECTRLLERVLIDERQDISPDTAVQRTLAACRAAQQARPDDASLPAAQARALAELAHYQVLHGIDPGRVSQQAIALAESALALDPKEAGADLVLAISHLQLGEQRLNQGGDPRASLDRAFKYALAAIEIDPKLLDAPLKAAYISCVRGEYETAQAIDPRRSFAAEIEYGMKVLAVTPGSFSAWTEVGIGHNYMGEWEFNHGLDPSESFRRAIDADEHVVALGPRLVHGYNNLCAVHMTLSKYLAQIGSDAQESFDKSLDACQKAVAIDDNYSGTHSNLGSLYAELARWQVQRDVDPTTAIEQARREADRSLAIDSDGSVAFVNRVVVGTLAGRWAMAHGRDPMPAFRSAEADARRWLALKAKSSVDALSEVAQLFRWRAEWRRRQGEPVDADVREGLAVVMRALALDANSGPALAAEGALHLTLARTARSVGRRIADAEEARAAFEKALAANAHLAHEMKPLSDEAQRLATRP
jgi:serine/threonine-protein kinase